MSSSSPRTKPSIDPPSNVTRPSSAASSSSTGIETFLLTPKMSAKTKRTKRTFCSRASRTTSRFAGAGATQTELWSSSIATAKRRVS